MAQIVSNREAKRRNYSRRITGIRKKHKLPGLNQSDTVELIDRLMRIPGTVDDGDLRTVLRLFCREKHCKPVGAIITD